MQVTNQGCPSMLVQFSTNGVTTRGFVLLDLLNSLTDLLYMYYIIKFFSDRNNGNVVETVIFHMGVAVQQLSEMLMPYWLRMAYVFLKRVARLHIAVSKKKQYEITACLAWPFLAKVLTRMNTALPASAAR